MLERPLWSTFIATSESSSRSHSALAQDSSPLASGTEEEIRDLRVDEWAAQQPPEAWQRVWVRHSTQGELRLEALRRQAWLQEGSQTKPRCWQLLATREVGAPETIKYSLSNAQEEIPLQRLAYLQRQRYWVERAFQEAKNEAGMDKYQARSWQAWHHHMALVMMALLFLL
jgi:SRSO17 transposase